MSESVVVTSRKNNGGFPSFCGNFPGRNCIFRQQDLIIIIKRISRAPIYHTRWQHRALYNNTNHTHTHMHIRTHARTHTHTHTHARAHTHTVSDEGMGRAVKNSLEIVIKQVRLEGGFKRGGRIRVAECLRQIVPDRWASIRKRSFTKCFCVYTGGDKGSCVRCRS